MKLPPSLTTVTPLSKFLALSLFILFPLVGFYAGMEYQKAIRLIEQQTMNQPTQPPSPTNVQRQTDEMSNWKTYRNEEYGFEFMYPDDLLNIKEKDNGIVLSHTVPYIHTSPCAFVGDEPTLQEITDFEMSLLVKNEGMFSAIKNDKIIGELDYVILQEPGYIDWVTVGDLDGYKITTGAECGFYTYYLGISNNITLVVTRPWELSTEYQGMPKVFTLPNIILDDHSNSLFNKILSTFRFLEEDMNEEIISNFLSRWEELQKNLSVQPVLGGSAWFVDYVQFIDDTVFLVYFEDGHISYAAVYKKEGDQFILLDTIEDFPFIRSDWNKLQSEFGEQGYPVKTYKKDTYEDKWVEIDENPFIRDWYLNE